MIELEAAKQSIWAHWRHGRHYPSEWHGKLSLDEGYRVQLYILDQLKAAGCRQAGWKVGLTAHAMRVQHSVHEPVFGVLYAEGWRASGHEFALSELQNPGFENELCITIGKTMHGPSVSVEQAQRSIATVAPALEIVEVRGNFAADLALTLADNAQQKAFVTGTEVALTSATADLARSSVEVFIDDVPTAQASGAEVMGNPAASIAWLANKLAEFDLSLDEGMRVMSGSFTRQYRIDRPLTVESRFAPFGSVRAIFR